MPTGYSLHIGLNKVDDRNYGKRVKMLSTCRNDALSYCQIAMDNGFRSSKLLLDECATSNNFYHEIELICNQMQAGDFFLLTFSGHGGSIPATDNTEKNGKDETWCFYDGHFLDNQLYLLWQQFRANTRILVISDSCHSGTILRDIFNHDPFSTVSQSSYSLQTSRGLEHDPFVSPVKASVKLLAAAEEDNLAWNDDKHGMFTNALLNIWNNGLFAGNYIDFYTAIRKRLPEKYPPAQMDLGAPNAAFNQQKPFQIIV
tara:strand:- start:8175 stop:8948 length:774 start_codon:yes stop_codon:yes gene_type:complete